ncbi:MAG: hypothetical protein CL878_00980 [Dehalococcoidia bacterium]|nr:hypothetical protein [Dehalococcoidia bacterium]
MITNRMTLLAVGVFVVLAAIVLLLERTGEPDGDQRFAPIVSVKPADVERVVIEIGSNMITATQSAAGKWDVQGVLVPPTPTSDPDTPRVLSVTPGSQAAILLDAVTRWRADRLLGPPGEQIVEFGLDQPIVRLTLHTRRDGAQTLLVGARTADESNYYVLREQMGDVVLVPRFDVEDVLGTADRLLAEKHGTPTAQ